jgi:hypothetical protein
MFPLSLCGTTFTWFTSLALNSIFTWVQLEQKFHEYFYCGNTELRLSHRTAVKPKHNESATEYTRNRCFNLNISNKDLADLAYSGLALHLKDKLESHKFCSRLWIAKYEPRSLGVFLGLAISLGMSATLTRLSIVASHRTTKRPTCA